MATKPRPLSKQQLLKQLAILDSIPEIFLPPTLPPSPPASRSASPATNGTLKRKLENGLDKEPFNKRARTLEGSQVPSPPKTASSSAGSPGQPPTTASSLDFVPTAVKPRENIDLSWCRARQDNYGVVGKMYKRATDARVRRLSKPNRKLDDDARENMLCFIEAAESVLNYAYSFWLADIQAAYRAGPHAHNAPQTAASWRSLNGMLAMTYRRGDAALRSPPRREEDRQRHAARISACMSMLQRFEGFMHAYIARDSNATAARMLDALNSHASSAGRASASTSPPGQQPTPPAVPSPAPSASHYPQQNSPPRTSAASGARGTLSPSPAGGVSLVEMKALKEALDDARVSASCLSRAQESTQLRSDALARSFPHTFRRLAEGAGLRAPSSGGIRTELALELEAAPGEEIRGERPHVVLGTTELEWPTVPASGPGAGIGALCCVTRAMIWEMGDAVGYGGLSTIAHGE